MVVRVVNVAGETVEKLVDEMRSAGPQWVTWNGRNKDGHLVGSGLYWVQIEAPTWTRRFSLIVRR
jgi:flagellar hook assembly protein FlgD